MQAFFGCTSAKKLVLGSSVETIDGTAFCNCYNIENELVLPDSVQKVLGCAFHFCAKNYNCGIDFFGKHVDEFLKFRTYNYDKGEYIVNDEVVYCRDCGNAVGHRMSYAVKINGISYDLDVLDNSPVHWKIIFKKIF